MKNFTFNSNSITTNNGAFVVITFTSDSMGRAYTYFTQNANIKVGNTYSNFNGDIVVVKNITKSIALEGWMKSTGFKTFEEEFKATSLEKGEKLPTPEGEFNKGGATMRIALSRKILAAVPRTNSGSITIDHFNPELTGIDKLGKTVFPEKIYVKNFTFLDDDLIAAILRCHVFGAKIGIRTRNSGWKVFENPNPKTRYDVEARTVYTDAIPKRLAEMTGSSGRKFIDVLMDSKNIAKFIPAEAWEIFNKYNEAFLKRLHKYNKSVDFEANNMFLKDIYKALKDSGTSTKLNTRLYIEAEGELEFDKDMQGIISAPQLTEEQRMFLYTNAKYYGVEIPKIYTHIAYRKISDGYAQYPERLYAPLSESERATAAYDYRRKDGNLPRDIRNEYLGVRECEDFAGEVKAFNTLMWIIHNLGDEGLLCQYARCPECGAIYLKDSGICDECGWTDEFAVTSLDDCGTRKALNRHLLDQDEDLD